MPTYTYECKKCLRTYDRFHPMSAKPRVKCEECGGSCRRLIGSGAGIIFKGSGFYETDYRRKSGGNGGSGEADTSGERSAEKGVDSRGENRAEKSDAKSDAPAKADPKSKGSDKAAASDKTDSTS